MKIKNLIKSVAHLIVDKFLEDSDKKTAICDAVGGKINAVYDLEKEEGIKKVNENIEKIKEYLEISAEEIIKLKINKNIN